MYVELHPGASPAGVVLAEPENCRELKVVVHGDDLVAAGELLRPFGRFEGPDVAWLAIDGIRRLADGATGPDWSHDFEAMVEYAQTKGWLDEQRAHLRAHCEWTT